MIILAQFSERYDNSLSIVHQDDYISYNVVRQLLVSICKKE